MRDPTPDELAAIAAAYAAVMQGREERAALDASRWALAGRLELEADDARTVAAATNRWSRAARVYR